MAYDAQREATARYNRKKYERVELRVKKGQREIIKKGRRGTRQKPQPFRPGFDCEGAGAG